MANKPKTKIFLAVAMCCSIALDVEAEIYKWKNAAGQWQYSTTPPPDAGKVQATGIQTEYATAPQFVPKPTPKEPEPQGPQVISISEDRARGSLCDTASNGYLSNLGRGGDALQDAHWKRCRGMR